MAVISKDLGAVTAYAAAVNRGYTGTKEEFETLMASYATVAEQAAESATNAGQSAQSASQSATDAQTAQDTAQAAASSAQTFKSAAEGFAQSAQQSAQSASQSAQTAESAKETAVSTVDGFDSYAQQALDSVNQAGNNWKSLAERQAENSEAYALGTRDGEDVGSSDPAYHNNAKYYAESVSASAQTATEAAQTATAKASEAQASASAAAESARTLTIDDTLTQSGQAADSKAVGDAFRDIITTDKSKNLCDPSEIETGGLQSDDSISKTGSWASYSTSGYIEVSPNSSYVFGVFLNTTLELTTDRRICAQYDSNKNLISGTYRNVSDGSSFLSIATVSTTKYIRVCSLSAHRLFQVEAGDSPTSYAEYFNVQSINMLLGDIPLNQIVPLSGNILYGKKWAVLGDSFTAGGVTPVIEDGRYKGMPYVYPYLIGNRNNMDIVSFFGGGRTLAFPANPDTFVNSVTCPSQSFYYQNIPSDIDYITIYLGINDSHHENGGGGDGEDATGVIPIGTINDSDTSTYYGAWNVVLTWLITNRPFAHIGMIISNGCDRDEYRIAQLEIAKKYGMPYIDLNGDERTPAMIRSRNPDIAGFVRTAITVKQAVDYSGGNLHPSPQAHEYESTFIENFLRSI